MTDQKKSDQTTSSEKPWGGRFSEPTDAFVERFTQQCDASVHSLVLLSLSHVECI